MGLENLMAEELLQAKKDVSNVDKKADVLQKELSDAEAKIFMKYIKLALTQVVGAGVPVPQDGGAGLKTTMTAAINNL